MVEISKKVSRRTRSTYAVLYREPRQIVASFEPGDVITFRESGRRDTWSITIEDAFRYAVRRKALADAAEKKRAKAEARKNRL